MTTHAVPRLLRLHRIAAGAALALAAGLAAAACFGGASVFSLEVGDCFNDPSSLAGDVEDVDTVSCAELHDNEVYAISDHPAGDDAPYPGASVLDGFAEDYCLGEFAGYVGIAYEASRLDVSWFVPTTGSWEEAGDREVICFLYDFDFRRLSGSMRGSRE